MYKQIDQRVDFDSIFYAFLYQKTDIFPGLGFGNGYNFDGILVQDNSVI